MPSVLPPSVSLPVALATAAVVYAVYSRAMPPIADIRVADQQNADLRSAEKAATWTATGIVSAISLVTRDPDIFVVGGLTVVILAWTHRHANMVNPQTGKAVQSIRAPELVPETQEQIPQSYGYSGEASGF